MLLVGSYTASGIAVSDSTLDELFIPVQTFAQVGTSSYTVESFDQTRFTAITSITIDNVVGKPMGLVRWGTNGLTVAWQIIWRRFLHAIWRVAG
jgi:hypothetical protein